MGLVGGLIAAPCTGPFLAGLLAFVTTTGNVIGGGSLLFVYALGMGVLFWVLAAFAMSLPKSGRWMDSVKSAGGIGLLFGAIYFLRPLLPFMRTIASPEMWFLYVSIGLIIASASCSARSTCRSTARRERSGRKGARHRARARRRDRRVDVEADAEAAPAVDHRRESRVRARRAPSTRA